MDTVFQSFKARSDTRTTETLFKTNAKFYNHYLDLEIA